MTDDSVETRVGRLERKFEAYQARISELEDTLDETTAERDELRERVAELESDLEEMDERTDLLQNVSENSATSRERRVAILLQTLYEDAAARRDAHPDEPSRASMTAREAWNTVRRTVERTMMYHDFQKAEDLVDDADVVWYEDSGTHQLVLDLDAGEPPATIAGHTIKPRRGRADG